MSFQPVWELREISKRFGPVLANDRVSLSLVGGQIHALLGENGSGKSTLIKILSGAQQADTGAILHLGQRETLHSPAAARRQGVATVFQEFSIVADMTVAENIALGQWAGHRFGIDWAAIRNRAKEVLSELGIDLDVDRPVAELSVAQQQLVEIAKAMSRKATLLILDEPTTALAAREVEHLFVLLRRLRSDGVAILYVSHRLEEVVQLADCATVMRNGRVVSTAAETPLDIAGIVSRMIGGELTSHYPKQQNTTETPLLEVIGLATETGLSEVTLAVHKGEVLGLGGPLGSGRTELLRAIFGADRVTAGEILVDGRKVVLKTPRAAIDAGLALVTENRKSDGLFQNFDVGSNITVANLRALGSPLALDLRREQEQIETLIKRLQIAPQDPTLRIDRLSGGNQQKAIIGRWLTAEAEIFLLDEPTQGIDIGAKAAIYALINELTAAGKAVLLVSSDDEELLAMSDRIAIMKDKRVLRIAAAKTIARTDLQALEGAH